MFTLVALFLTCAALFICRASFADRNILDHQAAIRLMETAKNKTGEPLYSRTLVETQNTATTIAMFAGQADKTLGNLEKTRELPAGHLFIAEEIRFGIDADAAAADVQLWLASRGVLKFAPNADARPRYFPLEILALGGGLSAEQLAVAADVANLGSPHQMACYRLSVPEILVGGVPFVFEVMHNVAYAPSADLKILAIIGGQHAYDVSLAGS